jgi:hypothetical protein
MLMVVPECKLRSSDSKCRIAALLYYVQCFMEETSLLGRGRVPASRERQQRVYADFLRVLCQWFLTSNVFKSSPLPHFLPILL